MAPTIQGTRGFEKSRENRRSITTRLFAARAASAAGRRDYSARPTRERSAAHPASRRYPSVRRAKRSALLCRLALDSLQRETLDEAKRGAERGAFRNEGRSVSSAAPRWI